MNEELDLRKEIDELTNTITQLGTQMWVNFDDITVVDGVKHDKEYYECLGKEIQKLSERIKIMEDTAGE